MMWARLGLGGARMDDYCKSNHIDGNLSSGLETDVVR
jgi:hypothetical protein